jgi:hypothetical protein
MSRYRRIAVVRRSIGYLAAWALVTTVAIGLSWFGIRSAMEPRSVATEDTADVVTGSAVVSMPAVTTPAALGSPPVTPSSTGPPVISSAVPAPPSSTDGRPTSAQLSQGEWQPDGSYVHAFHLRGGDVVVRYRSTGAEALSATPAGGWSVAVEQPGGPLVVNFRTTSGSLSRLEATWSNGPRANVVEK